MRLSLALAAAVGIALTAAPRPPVEAAEQHLTLTEHVNRQWTNELLTYSFEAPQGACHRDSMGLDGPNYLVLRDSVSGGKPSLWQMWTASEKIGTPEQAENVEAFLADKPGKTSVPAHRLEGSRFTAVGRFNVDVEYYLAAPQDTQRWTMRWVQRYVDYAVQGDDYRDLLQLRLSGDGDYFVVMFPRFRDETPPQFATLGNGTVIKIVGDFGTDYCFLPGEVTEATADEAHFQGEAGSVQDRADGVVLAIATGGEVRYGEWRVSAPQTASLRVEAERLVVQLPYAQTEGGEVTLRAAGTWKLVEGPTDAKLTAVEGGYRLVLAPGVIRAALQKG